MNDSSPIHPMELGPERDYNALEWNTLRQHLTAHANTVAGREHLAHLKPHPEFNWVKGELNRVDEMRGYLMRGGSLGMGGMREIKQVLKKAEIVGSALMPDELSSVKEHLLHHKSLRHHLDREKTKMPLVFDLTKDLQALPELERQFDRILTPEGTVRDNASAELARIRRDINRLQVDMRRRIEGIMARLMSGGVLRGESFSIRDGRFVIPVKAEAMRKVKGIVHDRSATGSTVFIEPSAIIEVGNDLRSLELAERDEVMRILRELTTVLRKHIPQIYTNLQATISLDILWAKCKFASELDAISPALNINGPLRLYGAKHPLLALNSSKTVVPLTLDLGDEYNTLVISGPNAGGKSVALKCVGLMCIMTACGLPIPALPGTEIPLFKRVFAVIGDQQSIADDLSTFTAHTQRLKQIVEKASKNTLVLIDEIGAGTDPQEGASLSVAVLEKLIQIDTPTIVTTHHGALKAFAHATPNCANGSLQYDLKSFQPTYRFQIHIPGSSYALQIAQKVGIDKSIIDRAKEIQGEDKASLESLLSDLTERARHYENLIATHQAQTKMQSNLEDMYRRKLEKLQETEKELRRKMKEEADELLRKARRDVEILVKEIKERTADRESILNAKRKLEKTSQVLSSEATKFVIVDEDIPQPPMHEPDPEPIEDKVPEVGDWVMIDDSKTKGQITALSANGKRLCVAVGSIQLWLNAERLRLVAAPEQPQKIPIYHHVPDVPLELDIRGLDVNEALNRVERYLTDGSLSGRHQLGIIHGKGAGILSRHVRAHLKNHKFVKSFRFGEYGEGDYGITIVDLK